MGEQVQGSVPMVAQRYNRNANQIIRWRQLFRAPERATRTGRYVPVASIVCSRPFVNYIRLAMYGVSPVDCEAT